MKFSSFILLLLVPFALGVIQEIMIYTEPSCQGDSIGFRSKQPDLADYAFFLENATSYSAVGWWQLYSSAEYTGYITGRYGLTSACQNLSFANVASLRYNGPPNTATPAISIFEGDEGFAFGSTEIIVSTLAATNFGFVAKGVGIYGFSNWTLFQNADFTGNSSCLNGQTEIVSSAKYSFESVVKGCQTLSEVQRISILNSQIEN